MTMTDLPGDEDKLMEQLREAARQADPPPDDYLEFARLALSLRDLDAELGSFIDEERLELARDTHSSLTIDVVFAELRLSLHLSPRSVRGQLTPPSCRKVALVSVTGDDVTTESDSQGLVHG